MAISQNSKINTADLVKRFKEVVVSRILDGVVDSTNCPMVESMNGPVPAIEPTKLDNKKNVSGELVLGTDSQTVINATQLLTEIIRITRDLTRVGTYVVILKKKRTRAGVNAQGNNYSEPDSWLAAGNGASGEALFTPSEIRQSFNGTGNNGGIVNGNVIKAADLTNLFANMYDAWARCDRPKYSKEVNICHDTCHSPCHSTCHTHCHSTCHGWSGTGKTCHDNCELKMDVYNGYYYQGGQYIACHSVVSGTNCHNTYSKPAQTVYLVKVTGLPDNTDITFTYTNGVEVTGKIIAPYHYAALALPFSGNWTISAKVGGKTRTRTVNVSSSTQFTNVSL